jgi:lysine-specific demethylase 3
MSRFDKAELEGVIENMGKLLQEIASNAASPVGEPSKKDGASGEPVRALTRLLRFLGIFSPDSPKLQSPSGVVRTVGGSNSASGPVPPSPQLVQTSNGTALNEPATVEGPSVIPSHSTRTYTTAELTDIEFRKVQGAPLVVTGLGDKFGIRWRPEHFRDKHGSQTCSIVECQTDASKRITVGEFFGYFGKYEGRTDHWKLKDWPSSSDFKAAIPDLYEEFQKGVPMPNYSRRDGVLNIASHFPSNTVMPDLGT